VNPDVSLSDCFCGSVTVGERGQVVIPSEARRKLGIQHGDKLLVMLHPAHGGCFLCKIDSMRDAFSTLLEELKQIESKVAESESEGA
jgi:AbrB family looped-hinge helix DNA binding protein